jgi:lysophospholipase L1-like esterase
MKIRLPFLLFSLLLCAALVHAAPEPTYYLALGDSLAVGVQPSLKGDVSTDQGYVDDLYAVAHRLNPELKLEKLGCSGETTTTMINGGICYSAGSGQLAAAVNFLHTHRVGLITLDIGANDVDQCFDITSNPPTIDDACVTSNLAAIGNNLVTILIALQGAASRDTRIVAMNYYDPFLAAWKLLPAPAGPALACASLLATTGSTPFPCTPSVSPLSLNGVLESVYQAYNVPVAEVATAFRTSNFTEVPIVKLPINVFLTLTLTWMDAPPPFGPNVHPNAAGYAAIAAAFVDKIAKP